MASALMLDMSGARAHAPQSYGFAPQQFSQQQRALLAQAEAIQHTLLHANSSPSPGSLPATTSPSHPHQQQPRSPFLDLPTEIHIELARFLPFPAQWALKRTNRYFHSIPELAAPVSFFRQRHNGKAYQQDLLTALCAAAIVRRGYEPCHSCCRFRWKSEFEVAQYQRGFLWCGAGADDAPTVWGHGVDGAVFENGKFCIECGVRAGKYVAGETVEVVQDWSDCHEDRKSVVVGAPADRGRRTGVMVSEQGQEDLEMKFNECGRFGCRGRACGANSTSEVVLDPTPTVVDVVHPSKPIVESEPEVYKV